MDTRRGKEDYYLDIADAVLNRSTCMRRKYGAIIVRNDEILCTDLGLCMRENLGIPSGQRYELCRSVHAEANAIISAARRDMLGGTLYLVGRDAKTHELLEETLPCSMCKRLIINAGLTQVVVRTGTESCRVIHVRDWVFNDDSLPGEGSV